MTAQSAAVDAIFDDPNMAVDAIFWSRLGGAPVACRIIQRGPDVAAEFGGSTLISDSLRMDIRVSEVALPQAGDWLDFGGEKLVVQAEPRLDRARLVWRMFVVEWEDAP